MASITITLPESWLTVAISVRERTTGSLDFSGTMVNVPTLPDIWPTNSYTFEFTEAADTDYIFIATAPGWYRMEWTLYRDSAGWSGWWATAQEVWEYATKPLIVNLWDISKIL